MLPEQSIYIYILLGAIVIWLSLLSFYLKKMLSHYRKLTQGARNIDFEHVLENIIDKLKINENYLSQISASLSQVQKQNLGHFQKSALIRFNPFEDAGGDQSFTLALLDGADSGVVISSLHSRSGTRIYAKSVVLAKASGHAFTKEEKEAVDKATRVGKIKER